jgi:hypothetical protein
MSKIRTSFTGTGVTPVLLNYTFGGHHWTGSTPQYITGRGHIPSTAAVTPETREPISSFLMLMFYFKKSIHLKRRVKL